MNRKAAIVKQLNIGLKRSLDLTLILNLNIFHLAEFSQGLSMLL